VTWRHWATAVAVTVACVAPALESTAVGAQSRARFLAQSYLAKELQNLDSRGLAAAGGRHQVDPGHLAAILLIERSNRSRVARELELLALRARMIRGGPAPDLSLGIAQMRITTAAWVLDGFGRPGSICDLGEDRIREVAGFLADDERALDLLARYLAYLEARRRHQAPFGVIASEYAAGPMPLGDSSMSLYGEVAQTLADSEPLRAKLEEEADPLRERQLLVLRARQVPRRRRATRYEKRPPGGCISGRRGRSADARG
jgi:hypothetical protein